MLYMLYVLCTALLQLSKLVKRKCYRENRKEDKIHLHQLTWGRECRRKERICEVLMLLPIKPRKRSVLELEHLFDHMVPIYRGQAGTAEHVCVCVCVCLNLYSTQRCAGSP